MDSERIVASGKTRQRYAPVDAGFSEQPDHARIRAVEVDEAADEAFRRSVVIPELERMRERWEAPVKRSPVRRMLNAFTQRFKGFRST